MRARARLAVELDGRGHSVVRQLRSAAPLTLMPAAGADRDGSALVRLVGSAAGPLGGDDLELTVLVGPGARLVLAGVAATLVLPGQRGEPSRLAVRFEVAERAALSYLPEPTVITGRAHHRAELAAELAADAGLHCREVLVLGRTGERPGRLTSTIDVRRGGRPVLRQRLDIGEPELDGALAHLAGHRVLASELLIDDRPVPPPASGDWWARTPLAACGWTATALGGDAVTALRRLECGTIPVE